MIQKQSKILNLFLQNLKKQQNTVFCFSTQTNKQKQIINRGPFTESKHNSAFDENVLDPKVLSEPVSSSLCQLYQEFLISISQRDTQKLQQITSPTFFNLLKTEGFIDQTVQNTQIDIDLQSQTQNINKNSSFLKEIDYCSLDNVQNYVTLLGLQQENQPQLSQYYPLKCTDHLPMKWHIYLNKNPFKNRLWKRRVIIVDCIVNSTLKLRLNNEKPSFQHYEQMQVQFICNAEHRLKKAPFITDVKKEKYWQEKTGYTVPENYQNLQYFNSEKQQDYEQHGWKISNINKFHSQSAFSDALQFNNNNNSQEHK